MLWAVLGFVGLCALCNACEFYGWVRVSVVGGGVAGLLYAYYCYEEIACTCDDPDHEH